MVVDKEKKISMKKKILPMTAKESQTHQFGVEHLTIDQSS